jgi:energy-converting hydrogenase Eha subunit H
MCIDLQLDTVNIDVSFAVNLQVSGLTLSPKTQKICQIIFFTNENDRHHITEKLFRVAKYENLYINITTYGNLTCIDIMEQAYIMVSLINPLTMIVSAMSSVWLLTVRDDTL